MRKHTRLDELKDRLARWRERHGGPGVAVPEELWAAAVEVARVDGPDVTARALRLDRLRLATRMQRDQAAAISETSGAFVELDAGRLGQLGLSATRTRTHTVVRLESWDGERLEIELGAQIDLAALAEAFWRRRR
jgi:hypothetical protein